MVRVSTALLSILLVVGVVAPVRAASPPAPGLHARSSAHPLKQPPTADRLDGAAHRLVTSQTADWRQQHAHPVLPEIPKTHFGGSLAIAGNTVVVGAPGTITQQGTAYVFVYTGTRWRLQATLAPSDSGVADYFGRKVVLSGDTVLITAPGMNSGAGAAYVYVRHGIHWIQQAKLVVAGGDRDDNFASSAALDGNTALLGAWGENGGAGAAYIFVRHGTAWTPTVRLTAGDGAAHDSFGNSVALRGNTALVGAWFARHGAGSAYVFVGGGDDWKEQARLQPDDNTAENWFGTSVALDADTALVGAPQPTSGSGAVYLFAWMGSRWALRTKLTAADKAVGDWFGRVVAVSGNTILVGAWGKYDYRGAAYLFRRDGALWFQQAELEADDGRPGDYFAVSVAVNGGTALVGAWDKDGGTGAVYVFTGRGSR